MNYGKKKTSKRMIFYDTSLGICPTNKQTKKKEEKYCNREDVRWLSFVQWNISHMQLNTIWTNSSQTHRPEKFSMKANKNYRFLFLIQYIGPNLNRWLLCIRICGRITNIRTFLFLYFLYSFVFFVRIWRVFLFHSWPFSSRTPIINNFHLAFVFVVVVVMLTI